MNDKAGVGILACRKDLGFFYSNYFNGICWPHSFPNISASTGVPPPCLDVPCEGLQPSVVTGAAARWSRCWRQWDDTYGTNAADNIQQCWSAVCSQGWFSVIFLFLHCAQIILKAYNSWHGSELSEWKWDLLGREDWDGERSPGWALKDSAQCQILRGWILRKRLKGLAYTTQISINLEHQYRQLQLPYQRDHLAQDKMFSVTCMTCKLSCWHSCLLTFTSGFHKGFLKEESVFSPFPHYTFEKFNH